MGRRCSEVGYLIEGAVGPQDVGASDQDWMLLSKVLFHAWAITPHKTGETEYTGCGLRVRKVFCAPIVWQMWF